jgi:hypothetical protein
MTTTLSTKPSNQAVAGRRADCPRWCTRTHNEVHGELVMHESTGANIAGVAEPDGPSPDTMLVQLNRVEGDARDRCYIDGCIDLDLDGLRELRNRINGMLILMGADVNELLHPVHALVQSAFDAAGAAADPLALDAIRALADDSRSTT